MIQSDTSNDIVCIQAHDLYYWITARDCVLVQFKKFYDTPRIAAMLDRIQANNQDKPDDPKLVRVLRSLVAFYSSPEDHIMCVCNHGKTDPICRCSGFD